MLIENGLCEGRAACEHLVCDLLLFRGEGERASEFDHRVLRPDFGTGFHETSMHWVELDCLLQGFFDQIRVDARCEGVCGKEGFVVEKKILGGVRYAIGRDRLVAVHRGLEHCLLRLLGGGDLCYRTGR